MAVIPECFPKKMVMVDRNRRRPDTVENSEPLCCLARRHLGKFLTILFLPSFSPYYNEHKIIRFLFNSGNQKLKRMLISLEASLCDSVCDNGLFSWHRKLLMSAPLVESHTFYWQSVKITHDSASEAIPLLNPQFPRH